MSLTTTRHGPPSSPLPLIPRTMEEAIRAAELMAKAKLVPLHLQGAPGDCLLIVEQAMRWHMSPYAVAQCTSVIKGKLMWEGKLVQAVIESSGAINGLMSYELAGEGDSRQVTVSAVRAGEREPRSIVVVLKSARTENGIWLKQPDQQLCYHGARVWARRWTPGPLLGIYTREEFDAGEVPEIDVGMAAVDEPAATRDAANASIPLKPTVNYQSRVDALERALTEETNGQKWQKLLSRALEDAESADEVAAIHGIPNVTSTIDKAPSTIKPELQKLFAGAFQRVAAPLADEPSAGGEEAGG